MIRPHLRICILSLLSALAATAQIHGGGGGGGGGSVTSVGSGCALAGGPITTTGTLAVSVGVQTKNGVSYNIANGDCGTLISQSNVGAVAYSLPQAGSGGSFTNGWWVDIENTGAGAITITPTTSTIDGAASLVVAQNQGVRIVSNGTNYFTFRGVGLSQVTNDANVHGSISGTTLTITWNSTLASNRGGLGADFSACTGGATFSAGTATCSTATGTLGSVVYSTSPTISAPTISGHPTIEGVTTTGATGTGNLVLSISPSISTSVALNGSSSGTITVQGQAASGTYNFNLPTAAGSSGQPLLSGGGGATAMTFGTLGVGGGGTGLTAGTSGGVLCYTGSAVLSSSAALTVNLPVIGGGAGVCPTVGSVTGTTQAFLTFTGANSTNAIPKQNASGDFLASGVTIDSSNNITSAGSLTLGAGSGNSGYLELFGATSGLVWFGVPNVAGTSAGLIFDNPTGVSNNFALTMKGATTCPNGAPGASCFEIGYAAGGGGTIPSTTDLLAGDGSGNASDSGVASGDVLKSVTSTKTYYVCSQANGTTCGSTDTGNGWHNNATVSTTIADSNNCTSVTTPCRTIGGVFGKFPNKPISATITIYAADNANTTTDCYAEAASTANNPPVAGMNQAGAEVAIAATYPAAYIYIYGNPTTPANATIAGNGCGTTTVGSNFAALVFTNGTVARVRGFRYEGYGNTSGFGVDAAVVAESTSAVYYEDSTYLGTATADGPAGAYGAGSVVRLGGTLTVSGTTDGFVAMQGGSLYTWGPLASPSANTTLNVSGTNTYIFNANETGKIYFERITYSLTGTIASFFNANLAGRIIYTELYTAAQCPAGGCIKGTLNATLTDFQLADEYGFIDADCETFAQGSCTVTQQPTNHSHVKRGGFAREALTSAGCGITQNITAADNFEPGGVVSVFNCGGTPGEIYYSAPNRIPGTPAMSTGSNVASAATITIAAEITHITGTTQITTINAISSAGTGYGNCVRLIPDGLWTTGTAGNIALATTAVVSKMLEMCYDPGTSKWYPSY